MWQGFQKDLLDFSLEGKNGIYTERAGKGFLGHQVKFSGIQATIPCDPVCFLLTLPKCSVFHVVIKVMFSDIREVIFLTLFLHLSHFPCTKLSPFFIQFGKHMGLCVDEEIRPNLVYLSFAAEPRKSKWWSNHNPTTTVVVTCGTDQDLLTLCCLAASYLAKKHPVRSLPVL